MAPTKMQTLVTCPNCSAGNNSGSPYCSSCGSPISETDGAQARPANAAPTPRAIVNPIALFTSDGQDRNTVKQMYDRASVILTSGEIVEYVAVARGSLGHSPDCVIASNKRLLVYRKKALGKVDLDDCYWRDMNGITLTDVKSGVNIMFSAIQGWHLLVENLPKVQASKLCDVATTYSERLKGPSQSATQVAPAPEPSVSVPTRPATTPTPASQSGLLMPHASQPNASAPLLSNLLSSQSNQSQSNGHNSTQGTASGLHLVEHPSSSNLGRSSGNVSSPSANGQLYIPTPESVLQNILQNSTLDGDLEAGVPTRPMQWNAAAFQAPALAEAQPVVLSETDSSNVMESVEHQHDAPAETDDGAKASHNENDVPTIAAQPGNNTGHDGWNYVSGNSTDAKGKGHDTEPQLRPAPPLTTLERIAVFTMPSGNLAHTSATRLSLSHDASGVEHPVIEGPLMSRWTDSYDETTGTFADHIGRSDTLSTLDQLDNSSESLRVLAEKISGPLEDNSPFPATTPHNSEWALDSTGVMADDNFDALDAQNTERISLALSPDQLSDSLYAVPADYLTAPDPQCNLSNMQEQNNQPTETVETMETSTASVALADEPAPEPEPVVPTPVPAVVEPPVVLQAASAPPVESVVESVVGPVDSTAPISAPLAPAPVTTPTLSAPLSTLEPEATSSEDDGSQTFQGGKSSHPTAPMGFEYDSLPVPGSMSSGPLLAASSEMNREMEDVYKNASALATQRLDYEPQIDLGDRPTSINLTMGNNPAPIPTPTPAAPSRPVTSWSSAVVPSAQSSQVPVEEPRKPRIATASVANRTPSSRSSMDDPIAKMKQLKAMLDAGFITDEDYAAKKAEILSRI